MTNSSDLVTAARKVREWTARRNALIRKRAAEGASQRQIGGEAGLSKSAVAKIVARKDGT